MPAQNGHAQALGDGFQPVAFLLRVKHFGQQQRVEHRLLEAHAGAGFLELQEPHVKGRVVRHQHRVLRKRMECRKHAGDGGLAPQLFRLDAVDGDAGGGHAALRIDELLEALLPAQLARDDAAGADLDDLVAGAGVEAGGLGVENGVGQIGQGRVGQSRAGAAGGGGPEEVEVVELGPAVVAHQRRRFQWRGLTGQR